MTQNFENHARIVPAFHYLTFALFAINFIWSIVRLVRSFSAEAVMSFLLAVAFLLLCYYVRIFPLRVQDRIIRLEMTLRLNQILPAGLRPRIGEFTVNQLIGLRFAGDEELPELARKVLDEKLNDRKAIKKMIRHWNADFLRV